LGGSSASYQFYIQARNSYSVGVNSNTKTVTMPDNTSPNTVSAPTVTEEQDNEHIGKAQLDVSFAQIEDLPSGIASGLSYYKILVYKQNEDNAFVQVGTGTTVSYDSSASTYDCTVGLMKRACLSCCCSVCSMDYSTVQIIPLLLRWAIILRRCLLLRIGMQQTRVSIDLDDFTGRLMKRNGRSDNDIAYFTET
jgi:hypothetical protein